MTTLLSMKYMLVNELDTSIIGKHVSIKGKKHPLVTENYLSTNRRKPKDLPYVFYTKHELRSPRRNYGRPSVRSSELLLQRAAEKDLDQVTMKSLQKISED